MTRTIAALMLLLAAALGPGRAAAEAPPQPVAVKTEAVIEGELLTLGDLFHGLEERAETPVARAPAPGEQVRLPARWLAQVARAYRIDWQPRSALETVLVRRASTVIDARRIEQAVLRALRRRGVQGELALRLDRPDQRLVLPSEAAATVAVTGLSYEPRSGRFVAQLAAPDGQAPIARARASGEAVRMVEMPVLGRRVEAGEVISADDLEWTALRADRVPRGGVRQAQALVGKAPRRTLQPGRPLRSSELREPVLVAKNSLVAIELKTPRMRLTAQGRAIGNGARGEVIRVVNTKSKATVSAVVVAPSTVSVAADAATN